MIEFVLRNAGEISEKKYLVIPPFRRNDDQPMVLDAFNIIRRASSKSQSGYNKNINCGLSSIDITTGKNSIYEIHTDNTDKNLVLDDLHCYWNTYFDNFNF